MTESQYSEFLNQTALVWNWPIGIYLFLLGISVGMVTIAILLKRTLFKAQPETSNIIKATAILAPITVCSGLLILVFHLTMPWTFWRLMIFYSPTSVMSIGVMLFQIYMVILIAWCAIIFRGLIETLLKGRLAWLLSFVNGLVRYERIIESSLLFVALLLGAYTGFLLSALKTYPLLNNPVLPILFMFSGISSGAAMIVLATVTLFKEPTNSPSLAFVHKVENPVVLFELFSIFAFCVGLYFGGGQKTVSLITAITDGVWGSVFWLGILGIGILLPLLLNNVVSHGVQHKKGYLITLSCMSLFGTLLLRLFVLYAGQMTMA